jgi:transposase-like protein
VPTTKQTRVAAINEAIERAGGIMALARAVGVTHQAIYDWRKRGAVPLPRAVVIAALFKIERDQLIDPKIANAIAVQDADFL